MAKDELLTRKELAQYLKCNVRTIDNYRKQGKFVACKVGAKVLFSKNKVKAAIRPQN